VNAGRGWVIATLLVGAALGGAAADYVFRSRTTANPGAQGVDLQALQADVERLKSLVPTQSHAMVDVGYHWANLWFAAQQLNWPLARFNFNEARQHVRWTVAIRPVRKGPDGQDVNVQSIWDGIEPSSFAAVDIAIDQEDFAEFEKEYRAAVETCYSCHKSVGLPHLRPAIPTAPATTVINFDPKAVWPQ
jgi:hypothetical protein